MTGQVCYPLIVNGQTCVFCPEVLAVTGVPAVTLTDLNRGWNASAYSASDIAGDVYTQFTVPAHVEGVFCGFTDRRTSNNPVDIPFAFYVRQESGRELWSIYELGVQKTAAVVRVPATDTFRIERRIRGGIGYVTYFFNGRVYYTSTTAIGAVTDLVVIACMYAAGDGVD